MTKYAFVGLELDDGAGFQSVPLNTQGFYEFTPASEAVFRFRAQARDPSGNVTFAEARVRTVTAAEGTPLVPGSIEGSPEIMVGPPEKVAINDEICLVFSEPIDPNTVNNGTIKLLGPDGSLVPATIKLDLSNVRLCIVPLSNLMLGASHQLVLASGIGDLSGEALAPVTLSLVTPLPELIHFIPLANTEDVALVGSDIVAVNHPDSASPADKGQLHAYRMSIREDGVVEEFRKLSQTTVLGRPLSLAVNGKTAYVGNRFLGSAEIKEPFVAPYYPGITESAPDTLLGCGYDVFTTVCVGYSLLTTTFPSPPSNLEVFNLGDPENPERIGASAINSIPPDIWDPNTWPNRVEMSPQGVAVQNLFGNLELFTQGSRPGSLGTIGRVRKYGEVSLDREFLDAAYFDQFAAVLERNALTIVSTQEVWNLLDTKGKGFLELATIPLSGGFGGKLGAVRKFEPVNNDGTLKSPQDLLFISTAAEGLSIYSINGSVSPVRLGNIPSIHGNISFDDCNGLAYIHGSDASLYVVDFNDPYNPKALIDPANPLLVQLTGPNNEKIPFRPSFNGNENKEGVVYLGGPIGITIVNTFLGKDGKSIYNRPSCTRKAKVSFLDSKNTSMNEAYEALNVSNYVTNDNLSSSDNFTLTSVDPDNFRIEVIDDLRIHSSSQVTVTMEILRDNSGQNKPVTCASDLNRSQKYEYDLSRDKTETAFRSRFIRLVSDSIDAADGLGPSSIKDNGCTVVNDQTVLVKLGDTMRVRYANGDANPPSASMVVGRLTTDNYNGPNQSRHDIRKLKLNLVIFEDPENSGSPAADIETVVNDIRAVQERFAQATIDTNVVGIDFGVDSTGAQCGCTGASCNDLQLQEVLLNKCLGRKLPNDLVDGYEFSTATSYPGADAEAVALLKDSDIKSIDVFYIHKITSAKTSTNEYLPLSGVSYPERLQKDLVFPQYLKNFVVTDIKVPAIGQDPTDPNGVKHVIKQGVYSTRSDSPYVLSHEILHILLDAPCHGGDRLCTNNSIRPKKDPSEGLLSVPGETPDLGGAKRKRIGPFATDVNGAGTKDTYVVREYFTR